MADKRETKVAAKSTEAKPTAATAKSVTAPTVEELIAVATATDAPPVETTADDDDQCPVCAAKERLKTSMASVALVAETYTGVIETAIANAVSSETPEASLAALVATVPAQPRVQPRRNQAAAPVAVSIPEMLSLITEAGQTAFVLAEAIQKAGDCEKEDAK